MILASALSGRAGSAPAQTTANEQTRQLDELMDAQRAPRRAQLALFTARERLESGDEAAAIAVLEDYLARYPDQGHYLVHYQLGNLLATVGRGREARPYLAAAVASEPRLYPAWRNLGEVAYAAGDHAQAAEAFATAFRNDPDQSPELLYYAAANWLYADRPDRAIPFCETIVSGRYGPPRLEWYRVFVAASLAADEPERASAAMAELVSRFPDDPHAWSLAHDQASAAGDYRRAARALTIVGMLRPLTPSEQLQLGDLYGAVGVPATAARYYAAALADSTTADRYERLASAYLASHQLERAEATLERALADAPSARLWSLAGDLYYLQKDYAAALAAYGEVARLDPGAGRAHLMMGYCALELGEADRAAEHLQRATAFPEQADTARRLLDRLATDRSR